MVRGPSCRQRACICQHRLDVRGIVEQWIEQIARPLAGNSNVHLCVGTMFAGPLLSCQ